VLGVGDFSTRGLPPSRPDGRFGRDSRAGVLANGCIECKCSLRAQPPTIVFHEIDRATNPEVRLRSMDHCRREAGMRSLSLPPGVAALTSSFGNGTARQSRAGDHRHA